MQLKDSWWNNLTPTSLTGPKFYLVHVAVEAPEALDSVQQQVIVSGRLPSWQEDGQLLFASEQQHKPVVLVLAEIGVS